MATSHTSTGATYSNLTRRELEQLRKADFFAGGKALTVGDESNAGSINDERFYSGPAVFLDDVWAIRPPTTPVPFLLSSTQPSSFVAESVRWYGPKFITSGSTGIAIGTLELQDSSIDTDFSLVQSGDLLLIKSRLDGSDGNANATGVISYVGNTPGSWPIYSLVLSSVQAPNNSPTTALEVSAEPYSYAVVRQGAVQLFAVPGSGPLGREQTFLAVSPDSLLHTISAPTLDQINIDRVTDLVSPSFSGGEAIDRADAIYQPPAGPGSSLDLVGYRPIIYRSLPDGSGPDWNAPLPKNPRIDGTIPDADQRMTIDYKAGVFRFSTPPLAGNDVKPTGGNGGVNTTTGRLQLWAVYWAADKTLTKGSASSVYVSRSNQNKYQTPARVRLELSSDANGFNPGALLLGTTSQGNDFYVRALDAEASGWGSSPNEDITPKVDFGASNAVLWSSGDPFRGFRIRQDGKIRMIQYPGYDYPFETRIEEKTKITVGGMTHPSGDYNNSHDGSAASSGLPNTYIPLQNALLEAFQQGQYSTVHLRRGVYRNTADHIFIPPGVTLEGEGYGTVLDLNSCSLKIGPNNRYGTYDPTTVDVNGTPYIPISGYEFPESFKVEGYCIVWNSARRVWGTFVADATSNSIWFNEIRLDGTRVLPGLGINVKNSAGKFFTLTSPNSSNLTSGHYPRAAHHPVLDEYVFTWTEEFSGSSGVGPRSYYDALTYRAQDTHQPVAQRYSIRYGSPRVISPYGFQQYTVHPSIAVGDIQSYNSYSIAIGCWGYNDLAFSNTAALQIIYDSVSGLTTYGTSSYNAGTITSSTDVSLVRRRSAGGVQCDFIWCWSERLHAIITGTTGYFSGGGYLSDSAYPNWSTAGVRDGDRFLLLHQTAGADNYKGRTGIVRSVSGSALYPQFEGAEGDQAEVFNSGSSLRYAIFPVSRVYCRAGTSENQIYASVKVAGPDSPVPSSTRFHFQEREPDFVRISGSSKDRAIIVYQNFDTRAAASRAWIPNFDNGKDTNYLDNAGVPGKSPYPVRVHLSTSFVIVSHKNLTEGFTGDYTYQAVIAPSMTEGYESSVSMTVSTADGYQSTYPSNLGELRRSNDLELIRRSLGSRDPLDVYPNTQGNTNHPYDDVSLRNYSMPIKGGVVPSFIPGVTWNGSDWVIVSPTVDLIRSDTGTLFVQSGTTQYLYDATFLFSTDTADPQGRTYRKTISVGDLLYFPAYGVYRTVNDSYSEHVVALDSLIGAGTFANNVEWVLVQQGAGYETQQSNECRPKCPGFRVGLDGEIIVSSSYTTFADEINIYGYEKPKQEVLSRNLFGNTLFNKIQVRVVANTNVPNLTGLGVTIDGVALKTPGDKVLLAAQSVGAINGVYIVSEHDWVRATEFAGGSHVAGTHIYVTEGDTLYNRTWTVTNTAPNDVVGTDVLTFSSAVGDLYTYADSKYGQKGMVWNDLIEGSRLEADLGFRGVVVGAPRRTGSGILHPTEQSHVAIAWGDNMYGFLDRERVDGQNVRVRSFRQSFGPYNSEIKNLTVRSDIDTGDMTLLSRNHVYTRHGGSGCPNPFFATDGYRNVFLHIGVWSYGQSWGENKVLNPPVLTNHDPRTVAGYNTSLCAVFTDITGKYTLRKRLITFPNISRLQPPVVYDENDSDYKTGIPEWQRDYLIGSLPQDILLAKYPSKRKPTYGARAIWTGSTFLGLLVVPRGLLLFDLGSSEEDEFLDEAVVGGFVVRDTSTYKQFELPKIKAFAYIGNGGGTPPGPKTNVERFLNECVGDTRSLEIVDVVQVDTCWAEDTLAVVWLAGLNGSTLNDKWGNPSAEVTLQELGRPLLGVTLFRRGQGGTIAAKQGRYNSAFNCTSYIIDTTPVSPSDNSPLRNGNIRDPKITWNGDGFTVTYLFKMEDAGVSTALELKTFTFPKEGLKSNFQIVSAFGPMNRESPRGYFSDQAIGGITSTGKLQTRQPVRAGDIILITRTSRYISVGDTIDVLNQRNNNSAGDSNLAGAYTVVHFDSGTGEADLGVDLRRHGVQVDAGCDVYGMVLSGDGISPSAMDAKSVDYSTSSGTVREGSILKTAHSIPGIFYNNAFTDLWGSFYVESQDKFVLFYNRGTRLGVTSFNRDGIRTAEVKLSSSGPNPDLFLSFSVGWNGTYFLL